jgi:hypothetical protein
MIQAIAWGLSGGACTALLNYLIFVKAYPPERFLKMGAASRMVLFNACLLSELVFLGFFYRHRMSLPGMGGGNISGALCLLSMLLVFAAGLIRFYAMPLLKARKDIKPRDMK